MTLSRAHCIRALNDRDPRFDGVFFVGVTSTKVYCRPVCPAKAPRRDRCRFFSNAAAAERMGFRPCLRCRPELAPGRAPTDAVQRIANSAAARIAEGALNGRTVDALAQEFRITGRQLRRVVQQETGVSPVALAQTHRLLMAKRLLTDTSLPLTQVAYASGFQSVRRFDALFQSRYRLTPTTLRARGARERAAAPDTISLTLAYRPPLAWEALLEFLASRATPGVELVENGAYSRTVEFAGHAGWVRVQPTAVFTGGVQRVSDRAALRVEMASSLSPVLMPLLARLRHVLDLDADPGTIEPILSAHGLAAHVAATPGLRVPGAPDGFELALRAVLGQQVSVKGATTLAGRFAQAFGSTVATNDARLQRTAPHADRVADASIPQLQTLGVTTQRAATIQALARAVADGDLPLNPGADTGQVMAQLLAMPGIGPWTAEYVAMRALRWPDGFPAPDLWLRRAGGGVSAARLARYAEGWRPWRAYAAMHLWRGMGAGLVVSDCASEGLSALSSPHWR